MLASLTLEANKLDLYPDLFIGWFAAGGGGLKGYIGDSLPIFWDTPPVKPVYIVVRGATSISDGRFKHFQQKWNNILVAASLILKPYKVVSAEWGGYCVAF